MQASNPPLWSVPTPPPAFFPFPLEPTFMEPPVRSLGIGIFQAFSKGRWWGCFSTLERPFRGKAGTASHPSWS